MGFNVGIIGCGSITRFRHAPEYKANPHVEEIVFYDRNIERAESLALAFGGRVATSLEELLNDPSIVAISDCSSNEAHHIHTTKALLQGKHVLCEKPLAISVAHAEEIVEAEKTSGKILMLDHNQRFTKAHIKAKEIIANKELGEVLTFKTTFGHEGPESWGVTKSNATWFFQKDRSYSGVAGDLGIHKIDLIHWLLDDEIVDVKSFSGSLDKVDENGNPIEVPDNVVCALKTKQGRLGTATFSWTYYGVEDNSTTIYCQKGIIKLYHDPNAQLIVEMRDGTVVKYEMEQLQTNDNQTSTGVIDAFIDCIVNEKASPVTSREAIASLKVIEKILQG
ncbi:MULTISPECIES: Gfo/Idh/MocA family oxidoreductase [Ornithinibacillus]|uniref:Gfo/Idh/MocA family oxidoreductase n=2 Tax=Ornithinibacillus TaxID=484508 RepID=A0A923L7T0_9BACI|nr:MULTISPECIES: Gfo/Idh/MocA family oxidoreductase [Ornithinibacillus]MBC5638009.1 Gfo/Idh/MocA family oxidoreductase [Ornithinibacillus hominis]MBS3681897.1 Gfo/Idh/MocA family oxidoreductase [Ornithinibacillus massiliensis]